MRKCMRHLIPADNNGAKCNESSAHRNSTLLSVQVRELVRVFELHWTDDVWVEGVPSDRVAESDSGPNSGYYINSKPSAPSRWCDYDSDSSYDYDADQLQAMQRRHKQEYCIMPSSSIWSYGEVVSADPRSWSPVWLLRDCA